MICKKCGQNLEEGIHFCTSCGAAFGSEAPGRKFLKITGIVFIVLGALGVFSLLGSAALYNVPEIASEIDDPGLSGIALALSIAGILLSIFLGVTGILFCNDKEKAQLLVYFVCAYFCYFIISSINTAVETVTSLNNYMPDEIPGLGFIVAGPLVFGMLVGLIPPVFYLIGALKNVKANKE